MFLKKGDTGKEVGFLQKLLIIKIDCIFGEKTENAVKEYQKSHGLTQDGIVGKYTYRALTTDSRKHKMYESQGDFNFDGNPDLFLYDSKKIWLIDPGHGGMVDGKYVTDGKRSPRVPPGIYEGVVNRSVANKLIELLKSNNISCGLIVPEEEDITLGQRIKRANRTQERHLNCVYVSIHQNAFRSDWNRANGIETYYYRNDSRDIAEIFQNQLIKLTGRRDRGIKKERFYVLRNTKMPSILTECGFMTNYEEAQLLAQPHFQYILAHAHLESIIEIEKSLK